MTMCPAIRQLTRYIEHACEVPGFTCVTNGNFRGGWTVRNCGQPSRGVHAIQMELACRSYLEEPEGPLTEDSWPPSFDPARAAPLRALLREVLHTCIEFGRI